MKILIGTISGILGIAIFIATGIFGFKRYKRFKKIKLRPRVGPIGPDKHDMSIN